MSEGSGKGAIQNLIAWGNPVLLATLAGAASIRLFDFIYNGSWRAIDILSMGLLAIFGFGWAIVMQWHLAKGARSDE